MAPLLIAAGVASVFGGLMQMQGYRQTADAARVSGRRANVAKQFEAAQLDQLAGQSIAASQRDMLEQRRQADLAASRTLALAAASGGGASDPTVVKLISSLKGESAYRSAVALYRGEEEARQLHLKADATRYEGALAEQAGYDTGSAYDTSAKAALFGGVTNALVQANAGGLFGKYA